MPLVPPVTGACFPSRRRRIQARSPVGGILLGVDVRHVFVGPGRGGRDPRQALVPRLLRCGDLLRPPDCLGRGIQPRQGIWTRGSKPKSASACDAGQVARTCGVLSRDMDMLQGQEAARRQHRAVETQRDVPSRVRGLLQQDRRVPGRAARCRCRPDHLAGNNVLGSTAARSRARRPRRARPRRTSRTAAHACGPECGPAPTPDHSATSTVDASR